MRNQPGDRVDKIRAVLILLILWSFLFHEESLRAQSLSTNPANDGNTAPPNPARYEEAPPPVIYRQKPVTELSDGEMTDFLQDKITILSQEDRQARLLRVAPGYPLSLQFEEPISKVLVGDPRLLGVSVMDEKTLVVSASKREGDTGMQVFFSGGKLRYFHIFIAENLGKAELAVKINAFSDSSKTPVWLNTATGRLDIRAITQIIYQYDELRKQNAIDTQTVRRTPILRKSSTTNFTTYHLFQFAGDPAVITFAYENPYPYAIRYDESRLRLNIDRVSYLPDYVSFNRLTLAPGEIATGFAIIAHPAFRFDQPFELIWK